MHTRSKYTLITLGLALISLTVSSCDSERVAPQSSSGASKVDVTIPKLENGLTVEQRNVAKRTLLESEPGAIKHLYVISAYSGQVLIYSTVDAKVTSSGKRLSPEHANNYDGAGPFPINIGQYAVRTSEVLGDDGTYGSSVPYVYWFDTKGVYHQHYVAGGQILHISDQPLVVQDIVINMELTVPSAKIPLPPKTKPTPSAEAPAVQ